MRSTRSKRVDRRAGGGPGARRGRCQDEERPPRPTRPRRTSPPICAACPPRGRRCASTRAEFAAHASHHGRDPRPQRDPSHNAMLDRPEPLCDGPSLGDAQRA